MLEKKRWLLVEIKASELLSELDARALVYEALREFLGDKGMSEASIRFTEFNESTQTVVLRCSVKAVEGVKAALALKRFWRGEGVALRVKKASGVIRKLVGGKQKN